MPSVAGDPADLGAAQPGAAQGAARRHRARDRRSPRRRSASIEALRPRSARRADRRPTSSLFGLVAVALARLDRRARARRRRASARMRAQSAAYAYLAPAAVAMVVLVFVPVRRRRRHVALLARRRPLDLHRPAPTSPTSSPRATRPITDPLSFYFTLAVTALWTVANVALHVIIGVTLALLLRDPLLKLRGVYRVLLIVPWAVPNYITALIWKGMFHRQFGAINGLLALVGLAADLAGSRASGPRSPPTSPPTSGSAFPS